MKIKLALLLQFSTLLCMEQAVLQLPNGNPTVKAHLKNGVICEIASEKWKTIVEAVQKSDRAVVRKSLEVDKSLVNSVDSWGNTLLDIASQQGDSRMVILLFQSGALITGEGTEHGTALHRAADHDSTEVVHRLLGNGASVDARKKDGTTPLYVAVIGNQELVALILLEAGASVDERFLSKGITVLFLAAHKGKVEMVRLLLENGATVDMPIKDGATPLYAAVWKGSCETVSLLLEKRKTLVNEAVASKGLTALFLSVQMGRIEMVRLLLDKDALVDQAIQSGATPLNEALAKGFNDIAQLLRDRGAQSEV